ncbi:polysaccharide deacetylase family protein [Eubacterium sp. 1001713B170207_170306_E7]|uniref:polysaccharide deacetylase family protein n=1 Tax=Eubacterium sp. 1001713B170207_170306_E7 TaxID=2787097 RepID=UPI00189BFC90|nr:polysaccharide deacetylase family protein [Eubacterium sp. 1001713B170207_170306_E7]
MKRGQYYRSNRKVHLKPRFFIILSVILLIVAGAAVASVLMIKKYDAEEEAAAQAEAAAAMTGLSGSFQPAASAGVLQQAANEQKKGGGPKVNAELRAKMDEVKAKLAADDTADLKVVFFTFDDGPSEHTGEILDLLRKYNIKATFFTNGREGPVMEEAYRRIVDEGHTLANHTWSHQYSLYKDPAAFYADVEKLDAYQKQVTGLKQTSHLFRFPGGSLNANATCTQGILDRGYNYVDWNVVCGDGTSNSLSVEQLTKNFIEGVHGHNVSTVLCHAEQKDNTRKALDKTFKTLLKEGYTFLPMEYDMELPRQI